MKRAILWALFLSGCGGNPPDLAATSPAGGVREIFTESPLYSESELLASASEHLRRRQGLSVTDAERCWDLEGRRERVRTACLMLWAITKSPSEKLERLLAARVSEPAMAATAALHGATLASWNEGQLLQLLDALHDGPVWVRARAVAAWSAGRIPQPAQAEAIVNKLKIKQARVPADFTALWEALRAVRPGARVQLFRDHCSASLIGEARLRCWRFLSAVEAPEERGLLVPRSRDNDWSYFRLNMPYRARVLENHR